MRQHGITYKFEGKVLNLIETNVKFVVKFDVSNYPGYVFEKELWFLISWRISRQKS